MFGEVETASTLSLKPAWEFVCITLPHSELMHDLRYTQNSNIRATMPDLGPIARPVMLLKPCFRASAAEGLT